ncbi:hypothetical protein SmJEL517_g03842 [Synchytrium microbalum]|uniref:V-type proton ATPase subunit H n=1 Tax=Synchytrium microbalum TaxID=1806994 RepID=A0A507C5J2_9FUNG|nr:uncharacterized protein SmJEL517_g03842 [Synchytrium microbalum]TPX33246.1 hypothetical protein SmJEL517_g03842 [Synchytrium microbalum]
MSSSSNSNGAAAAAQPDVDITAPVVASHNRYLEDNTIQIRARTIPWEECICLGYQRAALITEEELAQIRQFQKSPSTYLAEAPDKYIALLFGLLSKLVRNDTLQNLLVLIDDVLVEKEEHVMAFFAYAQRKGDATLPFHPFIKLLRKDDEFVQLKAAKIITYLVLNADPSYPFDPSDLFVWMTAQLQSTNPGVVDITVQLLQSILSLTQYRLPCYQTPNLVHVLVEILRKGTPNAQMQYQVIYCMWSLTYITDIAQDIQRKHDVIPILIEVVKSAIKEKVVRVIVATLKNMLSKAMQENLAAMFGNKVLNTCENLLARKWSDTEISEDLEYLRDELSKALQSLSTFDEYASEVQSGKLEWSPPHMSENFWKQNAAKLNERDYELLRILSRLIATSTAPLILAVAAHDIGQYVKYAPDGKRIVQEIGAKTQIMELMTNPDSDVRYQALIAVQKFMVNAWNF